MFNHLPVLYDEVMEGLAIRANGIYADGTLGGGGHASGILERSAPNGFLFAVDQDQEALQAASKRLEAYADRLHLKHANFSALPVLLKKAFPEGVDGILLDIGVSSYQIDEAGRGFSYMKDAALDMRMNQQAELSAYDIVNFWSEAELARIFKEYGEENWAVRIAKLIGEHRDSHPIESTFDLVDIIERAIPKNKREKHSHVAKRTFQALRIATNRELTVLEETLPSLVDVLAPGGRLAVISFHSLEDRIVKRQFNDLAKSCVCPPHFPVCTCNKKQMVKKITRKPIIASEEELKRNQRAASAKLRIIEKL